MQKQPFISVIVTTHNRPQELAKTLRSLSRQTYAHFEVLAVNNGGDAIEPVVRAAKLRQSVSVFHLEEKQPVAMARNMALRAARGEYIAYLSDTGRYYPQHLERLAVFLRDNPEFGAAYTDAHQGRPFAFANGLTSISKEELPAWNFNRRQLLVRNFIPTLCMMHRRSCLDQTGLFDETLAVLEDWDLWIRIARQYRIRRIPIITALYTSPENEVEERRFQTIEAINNLLTMYRRHEATLQDNALLAEMRMQYIIDLYRDLAETRELDGKDEEAERLWQRIVGLSGRPDDLLRLGLLRRKMGKQAQAELTMNLANELRSPRTANGE